MEDVTVGYETGRPVLHNVSLRARAGECIAIVGPTGAGKSTLVSLIPRFVDPWSGRVMLDGQDLTTLSLESLRKNISLVLQEPFLFPVSIAGNIAYGNPAASHAQIEAAARAANAHDFITRLPEGYDTVVGERGATLSGGERQRISIARALLKDAPILILDEPTSSLDMRTEALLLEALQRLAAAKAEQHIEIAGYIPYTELPEHYAWCDIFVGPSDHEPGPGNIYLEAMACEKPVIACTTGGAPEVVLHEQTGLLVPPQNPEALEQAISRLIEDPKLCLQLGQNGREWVQGNFTIDRFIDKIEGHYRRLISG